ncbi:MAG: DUF4054 domain-containing protein, partial [Pseudomonadota bacterium]
VWPAKDPAEVLDFTWTVPLDGADTIASHTATVGTGTVVKDSSAHSTTQVTVWLSGGTDGETATVNLGAVTAGGRTFREVAVLPVFDRASDLLALFRLRYSAFSTVEDGSIGYWLGDAGRYVGDHWREADRDPARLAYAAHMLSANGALPGAIPQGLTSFRSGSFSATVSDSTAGLTGLSATPYGREFIALQRASFAGPRLAWTPPVSGYA